MRVVSGIYRHRILEWPKTIKTRPTKDCVRESAFNALRNDIEGCKVLDLFAGSGSLGIEALSLKAESCLFVDKDKVAIETIKKNIKSLGIENAKVMFLDYSLALDKLKEEGESFDLIILDPPYAFPNYLELIKRLLDDNLLSNHGIIVLETDRIIDIDDVRFTKIKNYKYGKTYVTILRR